MAHLSTLLIDRLPLPHSMFGILPPHLDSLSKITSGFRQRRSPMMQLSLRPLPSKCLTESFPQGYAKIAHPSSERNAKKEGCTWGCGSIPSLARSSREGHMGQDKGLLRKKSAQQGHNTRCALRPMMQDPRQGGNLRMWFPRGWRHRCRRCWSACDARLHQFEGVDNGHAHGLLFFVLGVRVKKRDLMPQPLPRELTRFFEAACCPWRRHPSS